MPLKLKEVLVRNGIAQPELAASVLQATGRPMSRTAVTQLVNWGYWLKGTPQADLKQQIEAFLVARGIPAAEIAGIWDAAEDAEALHHAAPVGAHLRALDSRIPHPHKRASAKPEPDFKPMEVEMLSPGAKKHFKLFRDPFVDDVNGPDDVFISEDQRYIREAMLQTAKSGGFTAISGESGSGKSTLRKLLQHSIANDGHNNIRVIFPRALDKTKLSANSICTAIVRDIDPDAKVRSSLEALARQVETVLRRSSRAGFKHLLMIEEAHDLSIQTLKYLKRFWEIEGEDGFGKVLAIVLVGQPELKDKLDERKHPEAREVIRRCEMAELAPLATNLRDYLEYKFKRISIPLSQVFDDSAYDAIRDRWTKIDPETRRVKNNLYPLIVNNTVTAAMNRAAQLGVPLVTADLIKEL